VVQPSNPVGFVVNRRKPRVQTLVVSHYPALTPVHDFVLLFLPPCGPHLTPLATRSLKPSLLVSPLLGGPARHRPSRLLFTCTNANQATTCICNTRPRVSPHHVVNHSTQLGATIHRSSDAPVLNSPSHGMKTCEPKKGHFVDRFYATLSSELDHARGQTSSASCVGPRHVSRGVRVGSSPTTSKDL
jgi:hypothetical protein